MYSEIVGSRAQGRSQVEAFIRDHYWCAYGAILETYPERIFTLYSESGRPVAAAGLRTEADGFFSAAYLDQPLESAAAGAMMAPVTRASLLEICHLVSISSHAVFPLMAGILTYGRDEGFACGLFTATSRLRRIFDRLGVPFTAVAPATSESLTNPETWGSYYDTDPWVCLMPNPSEMPERLFPRCTKVAQLQAQEAALHG